MNITEYDTGYLPITNFTLEQFDEFRAFEPMSSQNVDLNSFDAGFWPLIEGVEAEEERRRIAF